MTQANTDLAIRAASDAQDFMPVLAIEQAVQRYNAVIEFTRKVMKRDRDYGTIPGTGKNNADGTPSNATDTLLKPGAEKLCTLFGLAPRFVEHRIIEDWDRGLFYYAYRCILSRNGRDVAESIGSANSFEKKYRTVSRKCPSCNAETIKRSKPERGQQGDPGWYCWRKIGGCGATFIATDPSIVEQKETVDPLAAADKINTLQKMAQKRSLVGATLIATNASEFFTQDVEDIEPVRQGDVIDGEVVNDADDDRDFLDKWDRISDQHKLPREDGRNAVLKQMFKRRTIADLAAATFESRKEMIGEYEKFTPDQIQKIKDGVSKAKSKAAKKTDSVAEQNDASVTPATVATWEDFFDAAWTVASAGSVQMDDFTAAVEKFQAGRKGDDVPVPERIAVLSAIRAGSFDYATGTIKRRERAA